MTRDERFPDEVGMDRRTFMKAAVGLGAIGLTGSLVASGKSLIPPPIEAQGTVNEGFVYAKADTPNRFGFDAYVGQDARAEHFTKPWEGVATVWRALFDEGGKQIPGTGFPVLLIRVEPDLLRYPAEWIPNEDFVQDVGLVALWDRCVHLCCFPGWHIEGLPSAYKDYEAERFPRTFQAGQDPIWCRCHNSQYDPVTLVWDIHPNGTIYIGGNMAHGPATRALAAVSIKEQGGRLVGSKFLADAPVPPPKAVTALRGRPQKKKFRDWYFAYCR